MWNSLESKLDKLALMTAEICASSMCYSHAALQRGRQGPALHPNMHELLGMAALRSCPKEGVQLPLCPLLRKAHEG